MKWNMEQLGEALNTSFMQTKKDLLILEQLGIFDIDKNIGDIEDGDDFYIDFDFDNLACNIKNEQTERLAYKKEN